MPIYEYACEACGHRFEEWQKMSDPPVRVCPKCKKRKVEKLISATAFQLKGGGWYADLYSSAKPGAKSDEGKAADTKSEAKSDAKSESKSEGKSESSKPAAAAESAKPAAKKQSGKKPE